VGIIKYFQATTLGDAWFQALYLAMTEGRKYLVTQGSYKDQHRAGKSVVIEIGYPEVRPLYPLMPEGSNYPPPTSAQDIEDYVAYLMTDQRKLNEHYTYGEDLHWQIEWVIDHFKKGGFGNNHCYMTVGRPETVLFYDTDVDYREVIVVRDAVSKKRIRLRKINNKWNKDLQEKGLDPSSQCLRGIDVWVEDNKLHFWTYFRSWDLYSGFPVNLGGIQLVKEYMAGQIGVGSGITVASSKDLHVYEFAWDVALSRIGKQKMEGGG